MNVKIMPVCCALCLALAACGTSADTLPQDSVVTESIQESGQTETASDRTESAEQDAKSTELLEYFPKKPTIEEKTIYDENGITVTLKELRYDNDAAHLTVECRNKTSKGIILEKGGLSAVNCYMADPLPLTVKAAAGESAAGDLVFTGQELALVGIRDIGTIHVSLRILDENYAVIAGIETDVATSLGEENMPDESGLITTMGDAALMGALGYTAEGYEATEPVPYGALEAVTTGRRFREDGYMICDAEFYNPSDETVYVSVEAAEANGLIVYKTGPSGHGILPRHRRVVSFYPDEIIPETMRDSLLSETESFGVYVKTYKDENDADSAFSGYESGPDYLNIFGGKKNADLHEFENVYDRNGIRIYYAGLQEAKGYDWTSYMICLLVENAENEDVQVSLTNICANGESCTQSWDIYENIMPGTTQVITVGIYGDDIEKLGLAGLQDIETLTFTTAQSRYSSDARQYEETDREDVTIEPGKS